MLFPKDFLIICLIVAISIGFLIFGVSFYYRQPSQISSILEPERKTILPNGSLVKKADNGKIYYIENGAKRWIESKEASRIQGFKSENIITVSASDLDGYQDGKIIDNQSYIAMPDELNSLPDLAPLPMYDLRLKRLKGRTILKFASSFWNQGKRHFELTSDLKTKSSINIHEETDHQPLDDEDKAHPDKSANTAETYQEVSQLIAKKDGAYRNKIVGSFQWHIPHVHYHYSDFADYIFSFIRPTTNAQVKNIPKTVRQKITFCIRDNEPLSLALSGTPKKAVFPTCNDRKQGISVGWIDIYKSTLPDQYIDVHDMPPGIYALSFLVDPNQHFIEERKDNNLSTVFIDLDVKKNSVKIVAAAAPFTTGSFNSFPDESVIRVGGEGKVYAIKNNKKRLLASQEIFNSYGYSWNNVFALTQSMIDSIPTNNLVRLKGADKVYALNHLGYKRHIINPNVFYSYNFKAADIADINQVEFENYPESNLIRLAGDSQIYLITGIEKKKIGTIETVQVLGYNPDSIHTINEDDFNAYNLVE